ncbi:MAG: hypothetical protein ACOX2O_08720 [Bdellovibrionota bacterium]|jgi:hypothetical protein
MKIDAQEEVMFFLRAQRKEWEKTLKFSLFAYQEAIGYDDGRFLC